MEEWEKDYIKRDVMKYVRLYRIKQIRNRHNGSSLYYFVPKINTTNNVDVVSPRIVYELLINNLFTCFRLLIVMSVSRRKIWYESTESVPYSMYDLLDLIEVLFLSMYWHTKLSDIIFCRLYEFETFVKSPSFSLSRSKSSLLIFRKVVVSCDINKDKCTCHTGNQSILNNLSLIYSRSFST